MFRLFNVRLLGAMGGADGQWEISRLGSLGGLKTSDTNLSAQERAPARRAARLRRKIDGWVAAAGYLVPEMRGCTGR